MDYLGIIGVLSKEIGIIDIIDNATGVHGYQKVTHGQSSMAMIYNMLEIFQRPLYLLENFMESKPIDRLLSKNIPPNSFNDDILGRTLDKLYEVGLEELFMRITSTVFQKYGEYQSPYFHVDTSLMKVHGEYNSERYEESAIEITYGYSKDQPRNLKQFIISLITCDRLPVFISTLSGNKSDKKSMAEMVKKYGNQLSEIFNNQKTFVFDTAFYVGETIQNSDYQWISRVPEHIVEAKELLQQLEEKDFKTIRLTGYKIHSLQANYADVKQRWIVVYSKYAYQREEKALENSIIKSEEAVRKDILHFRPQEFTSKEEAEIAAKKLAAKWKYHEFKSISFETRNKRGRPKKDEIMDIVYHAKIEYQLSDRKKREALKKKGRFIIATNILDEEELSDEKCLSAYKDQQKVEVGFKFIKDPMFFVDAVYLKSPKRIMSMVMLMGISLILYSLLEKKIRTAFLQSEEIFSDNLGKDTNKPTIRRIFNSFLYIHLHYYEVEGIIVQEKLVNMNQLQHQVLRILGPAYIEMYADNNSGGELIWRSS